MLNTHGKYVVYDGSENDRYHPVAFRPVPVIPGIDVCFTSKPGFVGKRKNAYGKALPSYSEKSLFGSMAGILMRSESNADFKQMKQNVPGYSKAFSFWLKK